MDSFGTSLSDILENLNEVAETGLDIYREVKGKGDSSSGKAGATFVERDDDDGQDQDYTVPLLIGGAVLLFLLLRK